MKKIPQLITTSIGLFWSYLLVCLAATVVLQVPLRMFIDASTKGEYFWKAIVAYICMVIVCSFWTLRDSNDQRRIYLKSIENSNWNLKSGIFFTIKNSLFWESFVCFSIWPIIIPVLFRAVTLFYFSESVVESVPLSLLVIVSIIIPFFICSFIAWQIVLFRWSKTKLHT